MAFFFMARPRMYDDEEELQKACDDYFLLCIQKETRPTVTGLALYLGFASKQSIYDYEKDEKFSYPIKRALTMIENELEARLSGNNVAGIIFALKNMGWKDKHEVDHKNDGGKFESFDWAKLTTEQLYQIKVMRQCLQN